MDSSAKLINIRLDLVAVFITRDVTVKVLIPEVPRAQRLEPALVASRVLLSTRILTFCLLSWICFFIDFNKFKLDWISLHRLNALLNDAVARLRLGLRPRPRPWVLLGLLSTSRPRFRLFTILEFLNCFLNLVLYINYLEHQSLVIFLLPGFLMLMWRDIQLYGSWHRVEFLLIVPDNSAEMGHQL